MIGHRPLSEVIAGWPTWAPQSLTELADVEPDSLKGPLENEPEHVKTMLWQLRSEVIRDRHSGSKLPPIRNAETVIDYLENRRLVPRARQWFAVGLDADRYRILRPHFHRNGDTWEQRLRYVSKYYMDVPDPEELEELPPGGAWLFVYGHGPELLADEGTRQKVRALIKGAPVVDVIFNHLGDHGKRTVFSLRDRVGATAGPTGWQRVDFPHHVKVEEASCW